LTEAFTTAKQHKQKLNNLLKSTQLTRNQLFLAKNHS